MMQRPRPETVTLDDIVITEELFQRPPRPANVQADHQAMQTFAQQLAQDSKTLLQTLVDLAVKQCQAGTAGVSELETTLTGEEVFCWTVLTGTLTQYVGETVPRDFSSCGVCLDRGTPQLFRHPDRYFMDFQSANTPIVEGLGLPLIANGQALGTLWIMSHDEGQHFDPEDLRMLTVLANLTATALLAQRQNQELRRVNAAKTAEIAEHKQVEERSRALISNLPGGAAFVVDRDLRYLLAEGEALATAGFKSEDFIGQTIFEVLSPELATSYEPLYRQALAGEPFEHEHNAHNHTYISRGTPLRAEREIYAVLVVSYDISDRKQAEAALRESEAKFHTFLSAASDIVYEMSADWREMRSLKGKAFITTTDNPRSDWTEAYIPETDKPQVWEAINRAIATRSNFELEHRVIRVDGTVGWTFSRAIPLTNETGEIVKWFGAASDITEQKQAEESLRESEAKYRSLFDSINEGYALIELLYDETGRATDWRFLEVNPSFERLTGFVNLVGKTGVELNPTLESYWLETYAKVAQTGEAVRLEQYVGGLDYWFDVYASRLDADKRHIIVVFNNITERKQHEERQAFLLRLSDALRPLTAPGMIQEAACRVLGEHLKVDWAHYSELDWERHVIINVRDYYRSGPPQDDLPSHVGEYDMSVYPAHVEAWRVGRSVVIGDLENDSALSEGERVGMMMYGIRAALSTPLVKNGTAVVVISVHSSAPRPWTAQDIALLEETAERTWDTVQRARAEEALRESEAWLAGQKEAFQSAMKGEPLESSLAVLIRTAVEQSDGEGRAAFYLLNNGGATLRHVVGLSEAYAWHVDNFEVSPASLACGLATHMGEPVITPDVAEEPRWKPWL